MTTTSNETDLSVPENLVDSPILTGITVHTSNHLRERESERVREERAREREREERREERAREREREREESERAERE